MAPAAGSTLDAWAASGLAWLTGRADGAPLAGSPGVVSLVDGAWTALLGSVDRWGDPAGLTGVDPLALLGERAALEGLTRNGLTSCGGSTQLHRVGDRWIAVALPRLDDVELLPAWLGRDAVGPGELASILDRVSPSELPALLDDAADLGLAIAALGEAGASGDEPIVSAVFDAGTAPTRPPLVVDLSALWAGPLCSHLLGASGASVVKVESWRRPDGMRRESGDGVMFFDLLNHGKRCVALDFADPADRSTLRELVARADVVIEASRPRALAQLGLDGEAIVRASTRPKVWVAITAHGRDPRHAMRIGFGDDAAVAGGLVAWSEHDRPCFAGDAIADPLTGIVAAAAAAGAFAAGRMCHLDIAMSRVAAAGSAGVQRPSPELDEDRVAVPRARAITGIASGLGADTADVVSELRSGRLGS